MGAEQTTWVIVVAQDHARRGLEHGFIMTNHGKRAPLARMSVGDGILIYSPRTRFTNGEPLKAITIVGEVTGKEPTESPVINGGYCLAASLREIAPLALDRIRDQLPISRLRFGCFALDTKAAQMIWGEAER